MISKRFLDGLISPCRRSPLGPKVHWRLCDIPEPRLAAHGRHRGRTIPIHPANNILYFK